MILCCGEALIDMIPSLNEASETCFTPHCGGAIFNTAVALGRLGTQTLFLTGLSTDLFGDQLRLALDESHVDTSLVITSDRPTTLAFVQLIEGQASYTFYDENTAGRQLYADQLPYLPDEVSTLFFGGISLISEPCADFYHALAIRQSAKKVIVVDPNIRSGFITDADRYRARLDDFISHADIVKVSDEDIDWIVPGQMPLLEKLTALSKKGPKIVILTKGGEGASALFGNGNIVDVTVPRVEIVDTVGAGDTFNAGFIAKLSENGLLTKKALSNIGKSDVREALENGARVAAITVSRSGANPPWADELVSDEIED